MGVRLVDDGVEVEEESVGMSTTLMSGLNC